jgi:hypothetical protein
MIIRTSTSSAWLNQASRTVGSRYHNIPGWLQTAVSGWSLCEFAVFEETELRHIPFAPGRIVWKKVTAPDSLALSQPWENPSQLGSMGD